MEYTKETYYQKLLELLPESNFTLDIFNGTEQPCQITCKKCNTVHKFAYAGLIARRARRNCKNVCKNCEINAWTNKQIEAEHKAKNMLKNKKTIQLISGLKSWASREEAVWKCTKCNHIFSRTPQVMFTLGSLNCPWCETRPQTYTEEMIKTQTQELWGNEYTILQINNIERNKNGSRRILVCHNKCGFKYNVSQYNFLHGQGCPRCKQSHGEWKLAKYLTKYNFKYQQQFPIYAEGHHLKLDFYLEENNQKFAIEYNGIQHYQPIEYFGGLKGYQIQQFRDNIKINYCKENNINLIIIPYNDESLINSDKLAQRLSDQVTE